MPVQPVAILVSAQPHAAPRKLCVCVCVCVCVWFRVQGSGFRVQGLGFRVQGSGFRV